MRDAIAAIWPRAWPNLSILELGDVVLGTSSRAPEFVEQMIGTGRQRGSAAYREAG